SARARSGSRLTSRVLACFPRIPCVESSRKSGVPMARQLLATKSIAELHEQESTGNQLRRALTATQLTLLGIGGIIGTGIFVLTGTAAANHAGPALPLAFIVAGLGCTFAGLCYAEFAAMIPVSGSAYSYSYATLGEGIAWFIGWNLILEYLFAVATVSVGWSGYAVSLLEQLHIHIPSALSSAPFGTGADELHIVRTAAIINVPAMAIVAAIATICYIGIKQSAVFNSVIVAIKVTVVVLFILFGVSYIDAANWHPFIPPNTGKTGQFGWSGIMGASGVIFFAYIGFDAISTAAQETKNPQRDMPIGILASLIICTVLYVLVAALLTGMVSYKELDVAALAGLFPVRILGELVAIGTLAAFVTVCLGVLVLRRTRPDLPRPFRAPWPWFTCIAGALVCAYMMYSLGAATWWRLGIWTAVGVIVYIAYGYQHSCVRRTVSGAAATPRPA